MSKIYYEIIIIFSPREQIISATFY